MRFTGHIGYFVQANKQTNQEITELTSYELKDESKITILTLN